MPRDEIAALEVCRGLLTATGARTSHVAVVARQLGMVCLVSCAGLDIDVMNVKLRRGDHPAQRILTLAACRTPPPVDSDSSPAGTATAPAPAYRTDRTGLGLAITEKPPVTLSSSPSTVPLTLALWWDARIT